jgi:CubicO group peptidase (beta-lactamase class C family)
MRGWIRLVTASYAVAFATLGLSTTDMAFAADTADCASPSDIQDGWAITSPQQQGLDPVRLCAMGNGVTDGKLANVDSIVVVRHGVLVYEHYFVDPRRKIRFDATTRHRGNSMTKSVVSLLVGIALERGLIGDLNDPAFSYLPRNADLFRPDKDPITVRHLLTMSAALGSDSVPGVSFAYNDNETELVGAILEKVTGKAVDVLAQEEIFAPLGITDVEWYKSPLDGVPMSYQGLNLRPRDWAKIGQLVLNHGVWEGKQIVPASWVAQSTAEQIKTEGPLSYGYQWWLGRSPDGDREVEWVAAMGFNSQKTIIIPALDMIVVFNASRQSKNMVTPELDLLNQYILPAVSERGDMNSRTRTSNIQGSGK